VLVPCTRRREVLLEAYLMNIPCPKCTKEDAFEIIHLYGACYNCLVEAGLW
jgi:hypothetical protein